MILDVNCNINDEPSISYLDLGLIINFCTTTFFNPKLDTVPTIVTYAKARLIVPKSLGPR